MHNTYLLWSTRTQWRHRVTESRACGCIISHGYAASSLATVLRYENNGRPAIPSAGGTRTNPGKYYLCLFRVRTLSRAYLRENYPTYIDAWNVLRPARREIAAPARSVQANTRSPMVHPILHNLYNAPPCRHHLLSFSHKKCCDKNNKLQSLYSRRPTALTFLRDLQPIFLLFNVTS